MSKRKLKTIYIVRFDETGFLYAFSTRSARRDWLERYVSPYTTRYSIGTYKLDVA